MTISGHALDLLHTALLIALTIRVARGLPAGALTWGLGLMAIVRMVCLHTPPVGVSGSDADAIAWPLYVAILGCTALLAGVLAWRGMRRLLTGFETTVDWLWVAVDMVNARRRALRG